MHRFRFVQIVLGLVLFTGPAQGATKPPVVSFGKWTSIKWCVGPDEAKCLDLKVRALYVDSRVREFTLAHRMTLPSGYSSSVGLSG
jgi:hypothetical protein